MAKRGGFPWMMQGNMNNMLNQFQKMQTDMQKMQEELSNKEFETTSGGGAVTVKVNGKKELLSIKIKEEVVDKDDVEMLEDLILSAVNQAMSQADESMSSGLSSVTGGMNIPGLF